MIWDQYTRKIGKYTGLALTLPISTFVGYAIGYGLDRLFHTKFLYLVFLGLGTMAGIIQIVSELQKDIDNEKPDS